MIGPLILQIITSAIISIFFAMYTFNNPDQNPSDILGLSNPIDTVTYANKTTINLDPDTTLWYGQKLKFNCYAQWDGAKYNYTVTDDADKTSQSFNTNFFILIKNADTGVTLYPSGITDDSTPLPVYYKDDVTETFLWWFMCGFILNMIAILGAVVGGLSIVLKN